MSHVSPLNKSPDNLPPTKDNKNEPSTEESTQLSFSEMFQIWQHFANVGGSDKDRMVAMLSFLLPLLIAATAYSGKLLLNTTGSNAHSFLEVTIVAGCATFGSYLTAILVLMYAGYANWNWSRADDIAKGLLLHVNLNAFPPCDRNQPEAQGAMKAIREGLHPSFFNTSPKQIQRTKSFRRRTLKLSILLKEILRPKSYIRHARKRSKQLSLPHNPKETFAPIFNVFYWATMLLMIINLVLTGFSFVLALRC